MSEEIEINKAVGKILAELYVADYLGDFYFHVATKPCIILFSQRGGREEGAIINAYIHIRNICSSKCNFNTDDICIILDNLKILYINRKATYSLIVNSSASKYTSVKQINRDCAVEVKPRNLRPP